MGRDKAGVVLAGETLLARAVRTLAEVFDEVLVVGCDEDRCGTLAPGLPARARAVPDERPGLGPVGGIASALAAASHDWVFVCACDMPLLDAHTVVALSGLVARTSGARAVAPRAGGNVHPLAAFYSRGVLDAARQALAEGRLSARGFLEEIRAVYIDLDPGSPIARALTNVNTPGDLAEAERVLLGENRG
jgi:molybdopterin-guanine dinucleotide biosynthesis protein A